MATKRLTIELQEDQYEFLRKRASTTGGTLIGMIRSLIEERRLQLPKETRTQYRRDPLYQRRGSFERPADLAESHDRSLY